MFRVEGNAVPAEQPNGSPRTSDRPMAFSGDEVAMGMLRAWLTFVALMLLALTISTIIGSLLSSDEGGWPGDLGILLYLLPLSAVIGGIVSFFVGMVGLPIAWCLSWLLAGVRARTVHLGVYALLGGAVGAAAAWAVESLSGGNGPSSWLLDPLTVTRAVLCAVSVAYGWWRTASRALRDDARLARTADGGSEGSPADR